MRFSRRNRDVLLPNRYQRRRLRRTLARYKGGTIPDDRVNTTITVLQKWRRQERIRREAWERRRPVVYAPPP